MQRMGTCDFGTDWDVKLFDCIKMLHDQALERRGFIAAFLLKYRFQHNIGYEYSKTY